MTSAPLSPRHAAALTAVLGLLSVFPPLATDMYLAAMGDLAAAMQASHGAAELSLSLFFLGLCLGQLILGPLIDGHGRRGPLLAGTLVFAVTSALLVRVEDIAVFNALRLVQAIGASAGMVVSRAIVTDLYDGRRAARVMTVLVMLLTIGPIVSPTLGSLLLQAFGWRSIFVTMTAISLLALGLSLWLIPETLPRGARAAAPFRQGVAAARRLLRQPGFRTPALIAGLVQGGMFAFITGSSGVFQGIFGLGPVRYGLVFAGIAGALVLFGHLNTRLLARHAPGRILALGLPVYLAAAAAVVLVSGTQTIWVLVLPLWIAVGMIGLLSANAMALAMSETRGGAGTGSALLGGIQFALAFSVSAGVALGGTHSALPMGLGLLLPAAAAMLLSRQAPRLRPGAADAGS
ncbi:multidrug effflux MFS transporter [Mangrovicoccus algicola]|uniref:multidrug effflux MFS transporter n=1 Tax=Mangrovicoccus algicola TaxID=2771008 RepID=UPI001D02B59D|nr:multidrug effflux MFS transporter [Mangrovicoccus algicola]